MQWLQDRIKCRGLSWVGGWVCIKNSLPCVTKKRDSGSQFSLRWVFSSWGINCVKVGITVKGLAYMLQTYNVVGHLPADIIRHMRVPRE